MRLTDEVDDVGTPTEKLQICKYILVSTVDHGGTYAGEYDYQIIPLFVLSALFPLLLIIGNQASSYPETGS